MKTAYLVTVVTSLLAASVSMASDSHEADRGVEGTLRASITDPHVHIHVKHGIVTIDGRVRTSQERDSLETLVRNTSGVVALKDELKVTSPTPGVSPEFSSGVAVPKGVVVPGAVPVYTTPLPEVVAVPGTPVVSSPVPVVIPEYPTLKVQAWTIDDEPIANHVAAQLKADAVPTGALDHISIMVRDGNVNVKGAVDSQYSHDALIASLRRAGGARAIYDEVRVR
jgi:hypothetical protein